MSSRETRVLVAKVKGVQCSFCESTIRKALEQIPGVREVSFSIAHEELLVRYVEGVVEPAEIERTLESLGFSLSKPGEDFGYEDELRAELRRLVSSLALSLSSGVIMVYMWLLGQPNTLLAITSGVLASVNLFAFGGHYLAMAFQALRRRILNQHVLMAATALAGMAGGILGLAIDPRTFPPGEFFGVASFVTTYHILGGFAGLYVRKRSSDAIRRLLSLQPQAALVRRGGVWRPEPVERVRPGDLVMVRPGDRIPLDGVVVEGSSAVDESVVTGESIPVDKSPGSEVVAGSINLTGYLVIRVSRPASDSYLARVARHMREVRALKPGVLQLLDTVLKFYVPGVLAVASAALMLWIALYWLGVVDSVERGFYAFLAALVMGYPCALGMSVPLAMIKGGYMAAEKGILFRGSEVFHALSKPSVIVFDKTGTLTKGKPSVVAVRPLDGFDTSGLLSLTACLEAYSSHPIALAIVEHAASSLGELKCGEVKGFREHHGKGVVGMVDGRLVAVGRPDFLKDLGFEDPRGFDRLFKELESRGFTIVGVGVDRRVAGVIALSDEPKPEAKRAVDELRLMGFRVGMLTGDNPSVAARIARDLGLDFYEAGLMPHEKTERIMRLQRRGERVVMVGDGVNDAPALSVADVGIALGTGSNIAVESADVVITSPHVTRVVEAVRIARYMYRTTKENLAIAFALNGLGVPIAATGILKPYWAMVAMIVSVTLILANTFLLRRPRVGGAELENPTGE
ncbi:MAG: cation-translocating P-type ATPase [Aeropyrum sp.]|nr:cation-translocating P-type ATPase [Aeropyrum sp.]